ncbi:hypothetical protein NQZ68_002797 [Dissostichus eleginoides]|nr:hypothetical protein NQZ68_002797 [Dissostichus eleginoides]
MKELVLKDLNNPPTGCVDKDGKQHDFGTEWTKDCIDCSCTGQGMSCCSKIPDTVDIPAECVLVVNKEACTAKIVMKSDPTKESPSPTLLSVDSQPLRASSPLTSQHPRHTPLQPTDHMHVLRGLGWTVGS